MDALGVYIFAGGFTQGMLNHANVVAHLEDKPYAGTQTSLANFPHVPIYFRDKEPWPLKKFEGIDLIFCNPPCAIFSPIGISTTRGTDAWMDDPRLNCWLRCYQTLDINPKMLVIETVPQILSRGQKFVDSLALDAIRRGYKVTYLEHDAGVFGTPQHRKRFFFIASKYELQLRPPNWGPVKTVGEALQEVNEPGWRLELRPDLGETYPHMGRRRNGKWESVRTTWCRMRGIKTDAKGVPLMPMFMLHRLNEEYPAGVFCGNYWLHPQEPRYVGINEIKVLCGYPQDYKIEGREGVWPTLLAQAVLPPVGDFIGASARRTLESANGSVHPSVVYHDIRTQDGRRYDITHRVIAGPSVHELLPGNTSDVNLRKIYFSKAKSESPMEEQIIRITAPFNPRMVGSRAFEMFKLYENGLKVREFIKRGGRLSDVKYDVKSGFIVLE